MMWRIRGFVLLAALVVGTVAWLAFRDSGITVSLAIATIYILLLSAKIPLEQWARVDKLYLRLAGTKKAIILADPCPEDDGEKRRHLHVDEVLGIVESEKMCTAHGSLKLTEKLIIDVRTDLEKGIWAALVLFAFWGFFSFAKLPAGGTPTTQPTASMQAGALGFDWWKGALTALIGFYKLATSVEFLHWFRKQNSQI